MDFHTLPRRDLQALCKINSIRANMTNHAMADALQALPTVEGLDQLHQSPRSPSPTLATPTTKAYHTRSRSALRPHKRMKATDSQEEHKVLEPDETMQRDPVTTSSDGVDGSQDKGTACIFRLQQCSRGVESARIEGDESQLRYEEASAGFDDLREYLRVVDHMQSAVGGTDSGSSREDVVSIDAEISDQMAVKIPSKGSCSSSVQESIQGHPDSINSMSGGDPSTKSDICANMTNVAMVDAVEARPTVDDHNQPKQSLPSPSPNPVTSMSTRKRYHTRSQSITKQAKRMKTTHNQVEEKDVPFITDMGEPTHQTLASEGVVDLSITPLEEKMVLESVTTRFDVKLDKSSDGHFRLQHCSRGVDIEKVEGEVSDLQDQEVRTGHERAVGHRQSAVGGRNEGKDLTTAHVLKVFNEPLFVQRSREDVTSVDAEFSDEMVVKIPSEGSCSSSVQGRLKIEVPLKVQDIEGQHSADILELQDSQEKTDATVSQANSENASEDPDNNRSPTKNDSLANRPPVSESIECSPDRFVLGQPLVEHRRREEVVEAVPKDAGFYDEIQVEIPARISQISIPSEGFGSLPMQATLEIKATDRLFSVAEPLIEQRNSEEAVSVDDVFSDEMVAKLPAERSCSSSVKGTLEFETPVKVRDHGDAHHAAQEKMETSVSEDNDENQASEIHDSSRSLISGYINCRPDQLVSIAEIFIEGSNEPLIDQRSRLEVVPMDAEFSDEVPVEIPDNTKQFSLPSKGLCSLSVQVALDIKDVGVRVAEPLIQGFNEHLIEQSKEEVVPIEAEFSAKMPVEIPANINQNFLPSEGLCSFSTEATLEFEDDVVQHSTIETGVFQEAKEPSVSQVSLEDAEDLATEVLDRSISLTVIDIPVTDQQRSPISKFIECHPDAIKTPSSDPSTKNINDTPSPASETIETEDSMSCNVLKQEFLLGKSEIQEDSLTRNQIPVESKNQQVTEDLEEEMNQSKGEDSLEKLHSLSLRKLRLMYKESKEAKCLIKKEQGCELAESQAEPEVESKVTEKTSDTLSPAHKTSGNVLKQEFVLEKSELQDDTLITNQMLAESENRQICEELDDEKKQSKVESDSLEKLHSCSLRKLKLMYKESKEAKLFKKEQGFQGPKLQAELEENMVKKSHLRLRKLRQILKQKVTKSKYIG